MEMIGYAALMFLGLLLGTVGAGGSLLAIPIMVYLFSLNVPTASAYALFMTGTTSAAAIVLNRRDSHANLHAALAFGIPSLASSFVTRMWIVDRLPANIAIGPHVRAERDDLLLTLLCVLMILSAVQMLHKESSRVPARSQPGMHALVLAGAAIGFVAGLVGAGGGFLILPSLVVYGRLQFPVAIRTTMIVISMNCAAGFFGDALTAAIQWPFLLLVTALSLAGMFAGYYFRHSIERLVTRRTFGWIMGLLGIGIMIVEMIC